MSKLRRNIWKQFYSQQPQKKKKVKHLGVNLTKDVNDFYKENNKP
jgi:hypothetical protein